MEKNNKKPRIRFKGFTNAWEQRNLLDVANYKNGKAHENDIDENGKYIVVNSKFVSTEGKVKKYSNKQNEPLNKNDIAFVLSDVPNGKAIAKTFLVDKSSKYTLNQRIAGITPHEDINPKYLAITMNRNKYFLQFDDGVKQTNLSLDDMQKYENYYPTKEEQDKLGHFFEKIDNLITLHQRKCDSLIMIKKALLEKMFPKNGENYPEIRFRGFTDAWEQRKFEDVFKEKREKTESENEDVLLSCAITGMYLNSELFTAQRGQSNIGYIKVKNGDLILSAQNLHLGNANVNLRFEHGIISPAYKVFSTEGLNKYFVQAWVKMDSTKNYFLSATTEGASVCRKNIEWNTLYKKILNLPSEKEQNKIGQLFKQIDNLITLHQRKLEKLKNVKKSLLEKMFV